MSVSDDIRVKPFAHLISLPISLIPDVERLSSKPTFETGKKAQKNSALKLEVSPWDYRGIKG